MGHGSKLPGNQLPPTPWGQLPPSMRVLFITGAGRTGRWLADVLAADRATQVSIEEAVGMATGLARLRDELFDAVLISHESGSLDALDVLDAIRAGSSEEQPILVLGDQSEQELASLCFEAGGDAYVCVNTTTTRTLLWHLARAVEHHTLVTENRRLRQSQRRQLKLERDEAERLLEQQRAMISDRLANQRDPFDQSAPLDHDSRRDRVGGLGLPLQLTDHYRELLRTYVIMGSGNLTEEMGRLACLLITGQVTSHQVMRLHLQVLEEMIHGLGNRSARHVMNRANMLILEMMVHLTDQYREGYLQRSHPPRQLSLPGFHVA